MRKFCRRKKQPRVAPTLVALYLNPEVSATERAAVLGLEQGWAEPAHFNVLADCRDMLALAAAERNDQDTLAVCELALVALENIKVGFVADKQLVAAPEELSALRLLADVSEDFWKRQGGKAFVEAEANLSRLRELGRAQAAERRAA